DLLLDPWDALRFDLLGRAAVHGFDRLGLQESRSVGDTGAACGRRFALYRRRRIGRRRRGRGLLPTNYHPLLFDDAARRFGLPVAWRGARRQAAFISRITWALVRAHAVGLRLCDPGGAGGAHDSFKARAAVDDLDPAADELQR